MAENQAELDKAIMDSINYLRQYFRISEVILFGSQLSGKTSKFSDIDLAVISPDFSGRTYEEILQIFAGLAVKQGSRVELHPFTEEDVKNARPTNFVGYLKKNGRVIFKDDQIIQ